MNGNSSCTKLRRENLIPADIAQTIRGELSSNCGRMEYVNIRKNRRGKHLNVQRKLKTGSPLHLEWFYCLQKAFLGKKISAT
ncbi:hypothetical protein CEXT_591291 [Caerostris extrusa]|uniref:Uncharacterized protein n=1 Tax=Caerostris extrusa TaxID=172846 RepID=A0AAV4UFM2_CAEEX|nr:hypothetical protein CEXT_591291 [Caerostris extrusa]